MKCMGGLHCPTTIAGLRASGLHRCAIRTFSSPSQDKDDLKKSLDHAAGILYELRTSELGPRDYYQVYMAVFGHMLQLQIFF